MGMFGALRWPPFLRSKGASLPVPHWPPTSGVLLTFGTGPLAQLIGPTSVLRLAALIAATIAPLASRLCARLSASRPTSNNAWMKPSGCVHCFFVSRVYATANADAVTPVSDDLNGCWGVHHTSVDIPSPRSPSASTERGNSNALPMLATLGRKPCCAACFQNVVQSGGIGTPVTICAFPFRQLPI